MMLAFMTDGLLAGTKHPQLGTTDAVGGRPPSIASEAKHPGERRAPHGLLDRRVAIARRETGVFRRPQWLLAMTDSIRMQRALGAGEHQPNTGEQHANELSGFERPCFRTQKTETVDERRRNRDEEERENERVC